MNKTLLLSALLLPIWLFTPLATPRATPRAAPRVTPRATVHAKGRAAPATAAPGATGPAARCPPCPAHRPRELTLRLSASMGGFYSQTTDWIRTDAAVRLSLGIRVHRVVVVQVAVCNSVERLAATLRAGALLYPWRHGLYAKGAVDVVLAGAGAQPGLALGVGFAWWSPIPLGLYTELELAGRLTAPRVLELNAVGGIFAYF